MTTGRSTMHETSPRGSQPAGQAHLAAGLLLLFATGAGADVDPFRVIAHRGASAYAPENTMPAFEKALELGVREVELDVMLTRDGAVILFHDDDLSRKTDGKGRVRDHDLAALRALDIGSWFDAKHPEIDRRFAGTGLITLEELFDRFGDRLFYHVEIKSDEPELPAKVLEVIRAADLSANVMVTSFDRAQLDRTRALDAAVPISLLVREEKKLRRDPASGADRQQATRRALQERWIAIADDARFQQVAFPAREMDRSLVDTAHGRGLEIRAWRIKGRADMEHAVAIGANGMTINWPDWLIAPAGEPASP